MPAQIMWKNCRHPSEIIHGIISRKWGGEVECLKTGFAVTLPFLSLGAVGYYLSKEASVCWKCDMKLPTIPFCPAINLAVSQPPRVTG